jgi:glycosyltransferase involved in cell wall biosynthesis
MLLFAFKEMHAGGGAEKNLIEVAQHFAKTQAVGFVISGGYIDPRMAAAGPVFTLPSGGRLWAAPLDLLYLGALIVRRGVRLVHAHHRYPAFLASWLQRVLRFKLITTVHNRFPDKARNSLWGDRAVAVSEDIARWITQDCGTPAQQVVTIHNGIQTPPQFGAQQRQATRQALGAPPGAQVLLAVGRLSEQKNFSQMLQALALLPRQDWVLWLVGEGEQREQLMAQIAQLALGDRVQLLGMRSDVALLMQSADLMVISSLWEGFPYVVVEALANGLPVVASDVGGIREGVIDGQTGWLVKPGDAPALSATLSRALAAGAPREAMKQQGRELFDAKFKIDTMFARLDTEFGALLAPPQL